MIFYGDDGRLHASRPEDLSIHLLQSALRRHFGEVLLRLHEGLTADGLCVACGQHSPCEGQLHGEWLTELYAPTPREQHHLLSAAALSPADLSLHPSTTDHHRRSDQHMAIHPERDFRADRQAPRQVNGIPADVHTREYPQYAGGLPAEPPPSRRPRLLRDTMDVWPMLADDMFRVCHEDSGKPILHRDVARVGLSAALIGELMLAGRVVIENTNLVPVPSDPPPDPLAAAILQRVCAEPTSAPVQQWLRFLATEEPADGDVYDRVAARLERANQVIRREKGFLFLRRNTWYMPTDMNAAAWPGARLSTALYQARALDTHDMVLGGLVMALGMHGQVLTGDTDVLEQLLRRHVRAVEPQYAELIHQTETAVGASVITGV